VTDHSLRDEMPRGFGHRLLVTVFVVAIAAPVLSLVLYTARERLLPWTDNPRLTLFIVTFLSIVFEALPFILVGALLSGLIEMFISPQRMLRLIPKSKLGQLAAGATFGVFLPVCECGVIVVLRRLLKKGMPLRMALAYLLAAPIVNPVVIVSTFVAFRGKPGALMMPIARVVTGVLLAIAIAAWVGRGRMAGEVKVDVADGGTPEPPRLGLPRRISGALDHTLLEFLDVVKFLIVGAAVAGLLQTVIARSSIGVVADNPVLGILAMMGLAVGLNLCSEADAFVAVGFVNFQAVAKLAFLVLGPMFDIKLLVMYGAVFRRRLIVRLVAAILVGVFAACSLIALVQMLWFGG
jgi:uncharacterized protein